LRAAAYQVKAQAAELGAHIGVRQGFGKLAVQAEVDERRLHNALFYGVAAPGLMHARRIVLGQ
jgi:hypothetical protein